VWWMQPQSENKNHLNRSSLVFVLECLCAFGVCVCVHVDGRGFQIAVTEQPTRKVQRQRQSLRRVQRPSCELNSSEQCEVGSVTVRRESWQLKVKVKISSEISLASASTVRAHFGRIFKATTECAT
jgi:hypothetical protein